MLPFPAGSRGRELRCHRLERSTMTRQKSFKRLVRTRMDKTGESYTAARAALLAADQAQSSHGPTLTMSDEAIHRRTGRGWEEWFDLLDNGGALQRSHKEIATWVTD